MAESIVSDVVGKLLEYAGKAAIEKIAPYFGGEHRLKELEQTMVMIQARLLDAERRGEGRDAEALVKTWLKRLKRILYQLEDLFEEIAMADKEKEQVRGFKLTKPIRLLFSNSSPLKINKKVAERAKAIMKELKDTTALMTSLNFRELPMEGHCRVANADISRETHSLVVAEEVIGRDEDKSKIVAMLLDSDHGRENVSVIPIVGIGGLGKTTLAQLVFNDENVFKHFELKCWACISDISSLHELAGKILMSISSVDYHRLTLDQIQSRLREEVNGKMYLLIIDDIWDEDRIRWLDLMRFLSGGKHGSKIIVTTRSKVVAQNMGTVEPHELEGLPDDKSWDLFKSLAFKPGQEERNPNLASIGKGIVKKCANVPLAIKTIACLLYSMDTETEWEAFKDKDLAMIEQDHENSILSTLKLSYDRLAPQLKQCFAYCSLFPKDHKFSKNDLICLWMAQGFLGSSNGHQSLEDVGHGFFMQLMRRCFFQDIEFDEDGEIIKCKMHDFVHDLAQLAAGGEALLVDRPTIQHISDNIWHVSFWSSLVEAPPWLLANKQMRSFVHLSYDIRWLNFGELFSRLRCLRVLDLGKLKKDSLLDSLGDLKHLRYLGLGGNLECLPECMVRLQNLQSLNLSDCKLRELPRGICKLINLRHFHYDGRFLNDMPPGVGQLTSLRALDVFVVGESNGLDALAALIHLAGRLKIIFRSHRGNAASEATVGYLKEKKLTVLTLDFYIDEEDDLILSCLQPPPTLKRLEVTFWDGVRFPSWGMDEFPCLLPNLVTVDIVDCRRCQHLPPLSRLPHLKTLYLGNLDAVEYIEMDTDTASPAAAPAKFFPSLESLVVHGLYNLKGWSRTVQVLLPRPFFPRLCELQIYQSPHLKSMPLTPRVESLEAYDIHGKLIKHLLRAEESSTTSLAHSSYVSTLQSLKIHKVAELESLSIASLYSLESLVIEGCQDLINLTVGSPTLSLQTLDIRGCDKLRDISTTLQHIAVRKASIKYCNELESLSGLGCFTGLESLELINLPKLRALPESIGHLTELRTLDIFFCFKLTTLPESFRNLASLQTLYIWNCPELKRRCEEPDGQNWPLIQHIPRVTFQE